MDTVLKYKIIEKIIKSNDEELLSEASALLGGPSEGFWDETPQEVQDP